MKKTVHVLFVSQRQILDYKLQTVNIANSLPRWFCNLFVHDFLKKAVNAKQFVQVCVLIKRNWAEVTDLFDILVLMNFFGIK